MDKRWIILYDGYCNLCSRAVRWIVRGDRKRRFTFVPLQHAGSLEELRTTFPDTVIGSTGRIAVQPSLKERWSRDRESDPEVRPDPPESRLPGDTVLLWMDGKLYDRSTAALRIALKLRFPWPLLGVFLVVPRFLRDPIYDVVARYRVRWFGRRHTCYLP